MWQQLSAIGWAQTRIMRNHLPRTALGNVLAWVVSFVWYGLYLCLGVWAAVVLPSVELAQLRAWLPVGLLAVFFFWQIVPLITLSAGWSLQLNKLQVFPVSKEALFTIEVLLRFTTAPEMLLLLLGALVGLLRHPGIHGLFPVFLLLFIPFNLLLSLAVREILVHTLEKSRFREVFTILVVGISLVPQFLLRTGVGKGIAPNLLKAARYSLTPWGEVARLSVGSFSVLDLGALALWTAFVYALARWQFAKSLRPDGAFQRAALLPRGNEETASPTKVRLAGIISRVFSDPLAALLQKELQALPRMPRFRVILGMACIFSLFLLFPLTLNGGHSGFLRNNFLPLATLYGLLLMSDTLIFNFFGFDRTAVQLYLAAPVSFKSVLLAKNLAATVFVCLQTVVTLLLGLAFRFEVSAFNIASSITAAAVMAVFFLSIGNLSSVSMARPLDPTQTFRKQPGGKMQLWFLLCSLGMSFLLGLAYLAGWALNNHWAVLAVLLVEFIIGLIVYRVSLDSAVERGWCAREAFVETLSRGNSPVAIGS